MKIQAIKVGEIVSLK